MICPLCLSKKSCLYDQDKMRGYLKCEDCFLVFVDRSFLISPNLEKERYEAHENFESNSGYRNYLSGISKLIRPHLQKDQVGLDFGSGRTKILAELLTPFYVESYDLFFLPNHSLLERQYDFIILSEVIEHLRDPLHTMKDLKKCLNPGGQFFIKTKFYPESQERFGSWFYKRDVTHIQFFSKKSIEVLCSILNLNQVVSVGDDLYVIR